MADSKKKSILDKPLSSRGKNEVFQSYMYKTLQCEIYFCSFCNLLQISLSTYSFLFAELVSYSNNRSSSGQQLQEK